MNDVTWFLLVAGVVVVAIAFFFRREIGVRLRGPFGMDLEVQAKGHDPSAPGDDAKPGHAGDSSRSVSVEGSADGARIVTEGCRCPRSASRSARDRIAYRYSPSRGAAVLSYGWQKTR